MRKLFLPYLLLFVPVLALAQVETPIMKSAWKRVPGVASCAKINDNLGIMQVTLTDSSFELMALDNKMSVLWRDSVKGCGVACGKFKGNILAISDSGSSRRGNINPYYAYLIDPASGKIILRKKIFDQRPKHNEEATAFFAADGSAINLIVRQADINTGFLSTIKNKTEDLTMISLNEKLEPAFLKPQIPNENFVSMTMNSSGDFFLMTTADEKSLQVRRYAHGSIEPSEPIGLGCDNLDKIDLFAAVESIAPSETDRNILYLSIAHTNNDDDREVITANFNFATHQAQSTNEVYTHKHVREVEKSFVPVNNDFAIANLGSAKKQMRVQYVTTRDGKLLTVSAEAFYVTLNNITTWYGYSLVISYYDSDLKRLFQQVMPVEYINGTGPLTTGYWFGKDELKIVSNTDQESAYGRLDLTTGKWLKLVALQADGGDSDRHIIWFDDSFVVPFLHHRAFSSMYNVDLTLNSY